MCLPTARIPHVSVLFLLLSVANLRDTRRGKSLKQRRARARALAQQMSSVRSKCVRPSGAAASSGRSGPGGSRRRWPPGCSACCASRTWTPPTRCPQPPRRRPSGSTRDSCNQQNIQICFWCNWTYQGHKSHWKTNNFALGSRQLSKSTILSSKLVDKLPRSSTGYSLNLWTGYHFTQLIN